MSGGHLQPPWHFRFKCESISHPTTKIPHPSGWGIFVLGDGLEPIYMQQSGGLLLPPVQKLVATFTNRVLSLDYYNE